VEVTLNTEYGDGLIEKITMADDYETCIAELAWELAMQNREKDAPEILKQFPKPQPTFLIRPARRRKKKEMSLQVP
jgi:hypothetical protein